MDIRVVVVNECSDFFVLKMTRSYSSSMLLFVADRGVTEFKSHTLSYQNSDGKPKTVLFVRAHVSKIREQRLNCQR